VTVQLLVIAKAPVAGRVKTRLCPPCTPAQAAAIAAACLVDTFAAAAAVTAIRRCIVLSGRYTAPPGWWVVPQRGGGLGERLAHAFADTALPNVASLLVGMDTPQLTPALIESVAAGLGDADAVLAPARDGGWWALAVREPRYAAVLAGVPMSTADTAARTVAALSGQGLRIGYGPTLRDVDTADDARRVAGQAPGTAFAAAVGRHLPAPTAR
jgi:rSAM/selenodomain-associated transferase 1